MSSQLIHDPTLQFRTTHQQAMNEYATYKRFSDPALALEYHAALRASGIDCILVDNSPNVDITFSSSPYQDQTDLRVRQTDFGKADEVLQQQANAELDEVDKSHYLYSFEDKELYEVLLKKDEWSEIDYGLAQKILQERGQDVSPALLAALRDQRLADLSKPEQSQKAWIYLGYGLALVGGFLGMFIGWYLWTAKKTLPNGQRVYSYSPYDQRHGRNIFLLGLCFFVVWMIVRFW